MSMPHQVFEVRLYIVCLVSEEVQLELVCHVERNAIRIGQYRACAEPLSELIFLQNPCSISMDISFISLAESTSYY